ncbi:MAG TPA: NUDIX domain-containing protein [Patescibacteria group bacterium]|nr:NUDIX domain-containing protein [Patescibacteria group bacterium]
MKFEFSAGGIVFKVENGQLYILVSQHSQHLGWVFPKGLIGDRPELKGEKKETTAIREVEEETGAKGEILKPITPITFWYVMDGIKRKKTVYYFIMKYVGGDITKHDHEMSAVEWLPEDKVLERLTYKNEKAAYIEALPMIKELANL